MTARVCDICHKYFAFKCQKTAHRRAMYYRAGKKSLDIKEIAFNNGDKPLLQNVFIICFIFFNYFFKNINFICFFLFCFENFEPKKYQKN